MSAGPFKHSWPYLIYICAVAAVAVSASLLPRESFRVVAGLSLAAVLASSLYRHHKHKRLKKDTLMEYLLTAAAAAVILVGAFRH
jgi:predicted benzoate:H+ symporter BenE